MQINGRTRPMEVLYLLSWNMIYEYVDIGFQKSRGTGWIIHPARGGSGMLNSEGIWMWVIIVYI